MSIAHKLNQMKYLIVILIVMYPSLWLCSQTGDLKADTAVVAQQMRQANQAILNEDFDAALPKLQAALKIYKHYELWESYLQAKGNLVDFYTRKYYTHGEEALYRSKEVADELLAESRQYLGEGSSAEGGAEDAMGWFYVYLGFPEKALPHFKRAMSIQDNGTDSLTRAPEDWVNWGVQHYNLASVYQDLGKTREAIKAFHRAATIFDEQREKPAPAGPTALFNYVNAQIMLASNYNQLGKFELAREYAAEAKRVAEAKSSKNRTRMAFIYETMGAVEQASKQYKDAIPYYEKAVAICRESESLNRPILARIYKALANTHRLNESYDKAWAYLKRVENIYQKLEGDYHRALVDLWSQQASLAFDQKNYKQSEALYQKSNERHLQVFGDKPSLQLAANYLGLAKNYAAQNELGQALSYSTRAAAYLHRSEETLPVDSWSLNKDTPLLSESTMLRVLSFRARLLHRLYREKQARRYLEDVLALIDYAHPLLEQLRLEYSEDADKAQLFADFYQLYQVAVAAYLDLYELTESPEAYAKAFEFAEANKSILLMEAMQNEQALAYGGLPDSLITEEKQLKLRLQQYTKKWIEAEAAGQKEQAALYQKELLLLRKKQEYWQQQLQADYPEYYVSRYEQKAVTVEAVQAYLDEETCVLEYFEGTESLFLFYIRKDSFSYKRLNFTQLETQVEELRNWLTSTEYRAEYDWNLNLQLFAQLSHKFYKQLFEDLLLPEEETLLIIPDGALNYIPFEVLLTAPTEAKSYSELPYLIKKHPIFYAFSMRSLLQEPHKSGSSNGKLLAFAASYGKSIDSLAALRSSRSIRLRGSLQDLPGAKEEVESIEKALSGAFYYGEAANEGQFKQMASDYGVIHLAMHGYLDTETPMLSSLVFTENADSTEDNFLYAYELSNMNLQADLVVLSACETGYGEFQRGEGVLSLARSFGYAGVPSILMSLWQVNDQATAYIMKEFYNNLAEGRSKAAALRASKLAYLKQAKGMEAHPAFWSPFVQTGNNAPVSLARKGTIPLAVYIGSGVAILIGLLLFFRAKGSAASRLR